MEEIKFPAKLRNGGKVKIITVPKDYIEYYQLNEDEFVEVVIRKKDATSGIQNQYFQFSGIDSALSHNLNQFLNSNLRRCII